MLLTKKQYQFIHDKFSNICSTIRILQDKEKDEWNKFILQNVTDISRGIHIGKQSAFEAIYNLIRKELDKAYSAEYNSADVKIATTVDSIDEQSLALESFVDKTDNDELKTLLQDQAYLLRCQTAKIRNILAESHSHIKKI